MENTQVIEPAFRIIGVGSRPQRTVFSPARAAALAKKIFFSLMDHLGVCQVPRILRAQCIAAEGVAAAAETTAGE